MMLRCSGWREGPEWAARFTDLGFLVLSRELLDSPLDDADTTALSKADWSQIHSWRPAGVGETLFNNWD